jgi:hypothetical protein
MTRSLVEEIKSPLKMSSITDVTSVYFGGGACYVTGASNDVTIIIL